MFVAQSVACLPTHSYCKGLELCFPCSSTDVTFRKSPQIFNQRIFAQNKFKFLTQIRDLNLQHISTSLLTFEWTALHFQGWVGVSDKNIASGSSVSAAAISLHGAPENWTNIATLFGRNASPYMRSHFSSEQVNTLQLSKHCNASPSLRSHFTILSPLHLSVNLSSTQN